MVQGLRLRVQGSSFRVEAKVDDDGQLLEEDNLRACQLLNMTTLEDGSGGEASNWPTTPSLFRKSAWYVTKLVGEMACK